MANVNIPTWAGSFDTMARRVQPIIHLINLGKAVTPTEISSIVRPPGSTKDYSAKYITFLRLLGFDFTIQKDGRRIVSYTCIVEPDDAGKVRSVGPKSKSVKAKTVKATNVAKIKPVEEQPKESKVISNPPKEGIAVSSFSVDEDWDSVDSDDLKKLAV